MTEMTGRGWAKLEDEELHGLIVIHLGDESDFVAKRAKAQKRPRRKWAWPSVQSRNFCGFPMQPRAA
jgi:hypothetical protein